MDMIYRDTITSNNEEELVEFLIETRKKEKVSQKDLADKSGLQQPAISRMERSVYGVKLKTFCTLLSELGYEINITKKPEAEEN